MTELHTILIYTDCMITLSIFGGDSDTGNPDPKPDPFGPSA
jgi:hypothetical protein